MMMPLTEHTRQSLKDLKSAMTTTIVVRVETLVATSPAEVVVDHVVVTVAVVTAVAEVPAGAIVAAEAVEEVVTSNSLT